MVIFLYFYAVLCQGVYHRKYSVIHSDHHAGITTAKKLWTTTRESPAMNVMHDDDSISVECSCCTTYLEWKGRHQAVAKQLQKAADNTHQYQINQNEVVTVVENGVEHQYRGTIRASSAGPQGPCQGVAVNSGKHPYICVACDALTRGQTSPLNRRVSRYLTLKHPRSEKLRATQSGVSHKFVSTAHLEAALQSTKTVSIIGQQKIDRLIECNKRLLSQKWHDSPSIRPFVETLVSLQQQNKLSQFGLFFLENWMKKKLKGHYG